MYGILRALATPPTVKGDITAQYHNSNILIIIRIRLYASVHMHMPILIFGPAPLPRRPSNRACARRFSGFPENPAKECHSTELSWRPEILLRFLRRLRREPARLPPAEPAGSGIPEPASTGGAGAPGASTRCREEAGRDPEARRRLDEDTVLGLLTVAKSTHVCEDSAGGTLPGPRVS